MALSGLTSRSLSLVRIEMANEPTTDANTKTSIIYLDIVLLPLFRTCRSPMIVTNYWYLSPSWVDEAKGDRHPIRIHAVYDIEIWTGISSGFYQQPLASFNCILFDHLFFSSLKSPFPSRKANGSIGTSPGFQAETKPELTIVRRRGEKHRTTRLPSIIRLPLTPTDASSPFNNSTFISHIHVWCYISDHFLAIFTKFDSPSRCCRAGSVLPFPLCSSTSLSPSPSFG